MAELALITAKSLEACKVLGGHALRMIDASPKRSARGLVPQRQPSKRPSDASWFAQEAPQEGGTPSCAPGCSLFGAAQLFFFPNCKRYPNRQVFVCSLQPKLQPII